MERHAAVALVTAAQRGATEEIRMKDRVQAAVLARVKPEVILAEATIIILALVWLLVIQGPAMVGR